MSQDALTLAEEAKARHGQGNGQNQQDPGAVSILASIAAASDLSPTDIMGQRKTTEIVIARHLVVWMLRHHLGWGLRQIARQVGKSPATIWQSSQEADHLMKYDRHLIRLYSRTLSILGYPHGVR